MKIKTTALFAGALMGVTGAFAGDPYDYKELVTREVSPVAVTRNAAGHTLVDFGKDAIGWFEFRDLPAGEYEIVLGELVNARGEVTNAYPKSTIRCQRLKGRADSGKFRVPMPVDRLNVKGHDPKAPAILIPERLGVISAFRYAEIVSAPAAVGAANARQFAVNYPIDMNKSSFTCDNPDLVRVYDLCKYSILATSFCGVYVDGDRERTPYEADALINQLSHYAIDDDYSLARKSHEWLMEYPTWPTEWRQISIMIAWYDWMWTGDTRSIAKYYDKLKEEKLGGSFKARPDGLIVSSGPSRGKPRDIIDWPIRERDGYELTPVNSVVNAFNYLNLLQMADIAKALGKTKDAEAFTAQAKKVKNSYQTTFLDSRHYGCFDGESSSHQSVHGYAAALACGLYPKKTEGVAVAQIKDKGMACSVYFAQFLLEALCRANRADLAIDFITARNGRSWMTMLDLGTTITLEAWKPADKPNLDLNHAWGSAALNIISRFIVGVTPREPGFAKISLSPQPGKLRHIEATTPTAKGPVKVKIDGNRLEFTTPAPTVATWRGQTREFPAGSHVME